MSTQHHPADALLIDYAAGAMTEPMALLMATHLALCPHCRAQVVELEAVGGTLLESIEPADVSEETLDALMAQLDHIGPEADEPAPPPDDGDPLLPQPLRGYVGQRLAEVKWQGIGSFQFANLDVGNGDTHARLMRIAPGTAMPQHTHEGNELTLVLSGGFSDGDLSFQRGDVATTDDTVDHKPIADAGEPCICLAVTDAPLKLTGRFGRLLNPLIRF